MTRIQNVILSVQARSSISGKHRHRCMRIKAIDSRPCPESELAVALQLVYGLAMTDPVHTHHVLNPSLPFRTQVRRVETSLTCRKGYDLDNGLPSPLTLTVLRLT